MKTYLESVHFVLDTNTDKRVSQFYTRAGDALRKASAMRQGDTYLHYEAFYCNLDIPLSHEKPNQEDVE